MSFPSAGLLRSTSARIESEKKNAFATFSLTCPHKFYCEFVGRAGRGSSTLNKGQAVDENQSSDFLQCLPAGRQTAELTDVIIEHGGSMDG